MYRTRAALWLSPNTGGRPIFTYMGSFPLTLSLKVIQGTPYSLAAADIDTLLMLTASASFHDLLFYIDENKIPPKIC